MHGSRRTSLLPTKRRRLFCLQSYHPNPLPKGIWNLAAATAPLHSKSANVTSNYRPYTLPELKPATQEMPKPQTSQAVNVKLSHEVELQALSICDSERSACCQEVATVKPQKEGARWGQHTSVVCIEGNELMALIVVGPAHKLEPSPRRGGDCGGYGWGIAGFDYLPT